MVTDELVVQQGRPNKKVYSITPAGRERLLAWSRQTHAAPPVKDDLLVKLYGLGDVDVSAVSSQVAGRLEQHRARLALYEKIEALAYSDVSPDDAAATGRLLGLQLGLSYERSWIEWCEHALGRLQRLSEGT